MKRIRVEWKDKSGNWRLTTLNGPEKDLDEMVQKHVQGRADFACVIFIEDDPLT